MEVPDGLVGVREVIGQEAAPVDLREDAGVAPSLAGGVTGLLRRKTGSEIQNVDDE